jgi:hypothetical protein
VQIGDDDSRTFPREELGGGATDTGATTGDDGDRVGEEHDEPPDVGDGWLGDCSRCGCARKW